MRGKEKMIKSCGNCGWVTDGGSCGYPFKEGFPCNQRYWKSKEEHSETIQSFEECDFYEVCGEYRKSKEKNMSNKILMTEEQAREIVTVIEQDYDVLYISEGVEKLKQAGYIIKSKLQQKVEEAERMYLKIQSERAFSGLEVVLIRAFRELKQSHPEFKEK